MLDFQAVKQEVVRVHDQYKIGYTVLARLMGIHYTTMHRMINDEAYHISYKTMCKIVKFVALLDKAQSYEQLVKLLEGKADEC